MKITSDDVNLIASAKSQRGGKYSELSDEIRGAYQRVQDALVELGESLSTLLKTIKPVTVRPTADFYPYRSGVRGWLPKDVWIAVYPTENKDALAGNPQLFIIASERGLELGYGASVSPADFSNTHAKNAIRKAAPLIFDALPRPGSEESKALSEKIIASGRWCFRKKHRLPAGRDFETLDDWLQYLQSPAGHGNAAGTISRYIGRSEIDQTDLETEIVEMVDLFEPLFFRDWSRNSVLGPTAKPKTPDAPSEAREFRRLLIDFFKIFDQERHRNFSIDPPLRTAMERLETWIQKNPAVASNPSLRVKMSVGLEQWTKTPWLAILDERHTTSTQEGVYVVFLISEDLSVTYLTLNQGMTRLVDRLGQAAAIVEVHRVAEVVRPHIGAMRGVGFSLDNSITLKSSTTAASNYEAGTISHVDLHTDAIPDDQTINNYLEAALEAMDIAIRELASPRPLQPTLPSPVKPPEETPYTVDTAMQGLFMERSEFERMLHTWESKKNLVLQGAPGVGKSFTARRLAYSLLGQKDDSRIEAVQFHQSYSYEDFVQGYRPGGVNGFTRNDGVFFRFCQTAKNHPERNYVFIIDEINRGNLSKIFGELMLLIENDKRLPEWAVQLTYSKPGEERFFIPDNLYILGMLNTADRSLALVDYALRRRFAFFALDPQFQSEGFREHLSRFDVLPTVIDRIVRRMSELNDAISTDKHNLGRGYQIGHSFFVPDREISDSEEWYRRVVETEIRPLLEEYWFDDPDKSEGWVRELVAAES